MKHQIMSAKHTLKRKILLFFSSFLIITFVTLAIGEVFLRSFIYLKSARYPTQTTALDKELGWVPKKDFTFKGVVSDALNKSYNLSYTTDSKGFKAFGNPSLSANRKKVFYLGDSYTQAIEVSNNKTYYHILGERQNLETFAFGCRGFSTLQEYMVLDQYFDSIQPDLVLLQFCYNDFINNDETLERESIYNNNRRIRPYYINESIQYDYPAVIPFRWLNDNLLVFQLIFTSIEKIRNSSKHQNGLTAEAKIKAEGQNYPLFKSAAERTKQLLQKFKTRVKGKSQLAIFYVGDYQDNYHVMLQAICNDLDIKLISSISKKLEEAIKQEKNIYAKDQAHWNELGHQITAELLEYELFLTPFTANQLTSR